MLSFVVSHNAVPPSFETAIMILDKLIFGNTSVKGRKSGRLINHDIFSSSEFLVGLDVHLANLYKTFQKINHVDQDINWPIA